MKGNYAGKSHAHKDKKKEQRMREWNIDEWDEFLKEEEEAEEDVVNSPNHYKVFPDMEAIDVIRRVLTDEEWAGYCKGNTLKYRLRAGRKGSSQQDIEKADKYQEFLDEKTIL